MHFIQFRHEIIHFISHEFGLTVRNFFIEWDWNNLFRKEWIQIQISIFFFHNVEYAINAQLQQIKALIGIGDAQGLSNAFENGALKLRSFAATTADASIKQVSFSVAEVESLVAFLLQCIKDPIEVAEIVCNALCYEGQLINRFVAASAKG